jgi:hypothetical protein
MSKETAREYFEKGCNEYLRLFCEKHEFDYEDAKEMWVAGDVGSIVCCGDYFVDMQDIITDIEQDAPNGEYENWYDYCFDAHNLGLTAPNYSSWLKGCPRCSQGEINRLYDLKREFEQAVNDAKIEY